MLRLIHVISLNCKLQKIARVFLAFTGGFILLQGYYYFLLKEIPFSECLGNVSLALSGILGFRTREWYGTLRARVRLALGRFFVVGIGNAVSIQLRCISALTLPMYCGKPGRGVLKAVVLTYIVAGPISNMGINARQVVRVFACSTQLSYNLSMEKYGLMLTPLRRATFGVGPEVEDLKDVFSSVNDAIEPIQLEMEDPEEVELYRYENNFLDDLFSHEHRSEVVERNLPSNINSTKQDPVVFYQKKLQYRCENQVSRAVAVCIEEFSKAYNKCCDLVPGRAEFMLCWPLLVTEMCDLISSLGQERMVTCDSMSQVPSGLHEGFAALQNIKKEFVERSKSVHLLFKNTRENKLSNIQDATETAKRVQNAFEEKATLMHYVITVMNIGMALLFLRIFNAAVTYHDAYLTDIDHDNVYITWYFKMLDSRRRLRKKFFLLPLKKMERNKYIDVHSLAYKASLRNKLITRVLKVMLEVVTTTTFVMLDRLFYEALDVVRQHAEMTVEQHPTRDVEIEVEGTGILAVSLRKLLASLGSHEHSRLVSNEACLPRPRLMPYVFFFKIYGGYLWILLLLFMNPYTMRLRSTICSHFYPRREKQRILHLYNDILKKRMKMDKILRRKAVQAVRAHYLTGESLLSLRMKFPQILGWLRVLPAARKSCLICGEVEPRSEANAVPQSYWHYCFTSKCPFVYCAECWHETGARCLACDPSLAELSDVDSLTEDEYPVY